MSDANLPAVSNGGDLAVNAQGSGIVPALENLVAHLHHRAEAFDDISITLHTDRAADGATRSCFSFRACKQRR
jgi:hypothetical protein